MRKVSYILVLFISLLSCNRESKQKDKVSLSKEKLYDFDDKNLGEDNALAIANGVVNFLKYKDTTAYMNLAIPLKVQKHLFQENFKYRPDIKNKDAYINKLTSKNTKRLNNFLVRSYYIQKIMKEDKNFDITKAEVKDITFNSVRIKDYGHFDRPIVANWAEATVKMTYNNQEYFFEIPQIIEQKGKWFLYYPEYYFRDQKDKIFIDKYLENQNKKADEFLH